MRCFRKELLVKLLLVIPLWWSASPWHVANHTLSAAEIGANGDRVGEVSVEPERSDVGNMRAPDIETAADEGMLDCNSGPCAVIVANAVTTTPISVPGERLALVQVGKGLSKAPLTKPPTPLS